MQLQLTDDNPLNTILLLDGVPLYEIRSPGFRHKKTEVRKAHQGMPIEATAPMATIDWGGLRSPTMVGLYGQMRNMDEILIRSGSRLSQSRKFVGYSTGHTYTWDISTFGGHLTLLNSNSATIASYTKHGLGIIGPAHNAFIDLTDECIPMIDLVILTWIIMEQKHRDHERKKHMVHLM